MLQSDRIQNLLRQAERNITELPKTEQINTAIENATNNIVRVAEAGEVFDDRKNSNL